MCSFDLLLYVTFVLQGHIFFHFLFVLLCRDIFTCVPPGQTLAKILPSEGPWRPWESRDTCNLVGCCGGGVGDFLARGGGFMAACVWRNKCKRNLPLVLHSVSQACE